MKKYFLKVAVFALVLSGMTSCEEDKVFFDTNNGQSLAGFNIATGNFGVVDPAVSESPAVFEVEVGVTTKSNRDRSVQVVVNAENTSADPALYSIDQTSLVIPAGEFVARVKITADFNLIPESGTKVLTLDLVSVDGMDLLDSQRSSFTLEIFRVCPRDIPTTYTGFVTGSQGGATPDFTVVLTPTAQVATYTSPNFWGDFVAGASGQPLEGQYPYPGTLTINCDDSVKIVATGPAWATGGSGTFDPNTNEFQISVGQDGLFTSPFPAVLYYIPEE
ncbi:DUF1735 domain-containing protein [uncultured Flavobacterium sp.]|uniref:DUF1735 domain-containing protein n=1 Tax=uncultured Flavobacterium sp. TaxID=165435 RepID=UPI002600928C|nr:DUF1735 domain-containing protein [uncultured Flavobacterium sp.]